MSLFGRDERSFNAMVESLKKNGPDPAHPVVLWHEDGRVVDGIQRVAAAKAAGVKDLWYVEKNFPSMEAALEYATACQLNRRNISDAKLAQIVAIADKPEKRGGDRRSAAAKSKTSPGVMKTSSAAKTAEAVGVSKSKVEKARTIAKDKELKDQVAAGTMTLNAAYTEIKRRKLSDQERMVEDLKGALKHLQLALITIKKYRLSTTLLQEASTALKKAVQGKRLVSGRTKKGGVTKGVA